MCAFFIRLLLAGYTNGISSWIVVFLSSKLFFLLFNAHSCTIAYTLTLTLAQSPTHSLTLTLKHALQVEGAVWEPLEANPTLHPRSFFSQPTALLTLLDQDRNNAPYLVYVGDNWVFGPPHGLTEVSSLLILVQSHIYISALYSTRTCCYVRLVSGVFFLITF